MVLTNGLKKERALCAIESGSFCSFKEKLIPFSLNILLLQKSVLRHSPRVLEKFANLLDLHKWHSFELRYLWKSLELGCALNLGSS